MPFGISLSDFKRLGEFSLGVYRLCRDNTGIYRQLASKLREISNSLTDLGDLIDQRKVPLEQHAELLDQGNACKILLDEIESSVTRYNVLSTQDKRVLDQSGISELRERLQHVATQLDHLYTDLTSSPYAQVSSAISILTSDYQNGHRRPPAFAAQGHSGQSFDVDEPVWQQLVHDLGELGIAENQASEHRSLVVGTVTNALHHRRSSSSLARTPSPPETHANLTLSRTNGSSTAQVQAIPIPAEALPSYDEVATTSSAAHLDMSQAIEATVDDIVQQWNARNWSAATSYLQDLLSLLPPNGAATNEGAGQPLSRMCHHFLGIAASFLGQYPLAKDHFENVLLQQSETLKRGFELDQAESAAAKWLGDTCLMLNQPLNAVLAYCISIEANNSKPEKYYTGVRQPIDLYRELAEIEDQIPSFSVLWRTYDGKVTDPTTIFLKTDFRMKVQAVRYVRKHFYPLAMGSAYQQTKYQDHYQGYAPYTRRDQSVKITRDMLLSANTRSGIWPIPYDPTFDTGNAATLAKQRQRIEGFELSDAEHARKWCDSVNKSVVSSKDFVFITPDSAANNVKHAGFEWLLSNIKACLKDNGINAVQRLDFLVCPVMRTSQCITYTELVKIEFRRLSFKKAWGVRVAPAEYNTRRYRVSANKTTAAGDLKELLRVYLESANLAR